MVRCDRGLQLLLTTAGAFAAFSLMAIAIGTDYWLYSSAHICNSSNLTMDDGPPPRRARGDLTHSGLWRVCCIEGTADPGTPIPNTHTDTPHHTTPCPGRRQGRGWARHWLRARHKGAERTGGSSLGQLCPRLGSLPAADPTTHLPHKLSTRHAHPLAHRHNETH